jgi:hypothetical protein
MIRQCYAYISIYLSICLSVCLSVCLSIYLSIYLSIHGSTALCGTWRLFQFLDLYNQSVELLGRGISPSQGHLDTRQHKRRINAHNTDIHALSWIRTHDPSVRASEDS